MTDPLQTPFTLPSSSTPLSHRIVLAPMTRMRASPTGTPNPSAATYYSERTTPGSLLISEGIVIHPRGKGFPNTPGIWTAEQIEAWKPITAAVRGRGGRFWAQIWHVGRVSVPSQIRGLRPLASVEMPLPGRHLLFGAENAEEAYVRSEAMDEEMIGAAVEQFATAARNAIEAGFEGVEIHGGNGYLPDTFVHDNINTRNDSYGGSLDNRLRFPLEVVDAVVKALGRQRTAIQIAPFHVLQQTLDSDRISTFTRYVEELEKRHLGYVHIVEPRYDQLSTEGAFSGNIERKSGPDSDADMGVAKIEVKAGDGDETYSLWTFRKILTTTPLIGAGGYSPETARTAIAEARVDLVAFGRHFTSNPDLVNKIFNDVSLTQYDRRTFYTPGMEGYLGWHVATIRA